MDRPQGRKGKKTMNMNFEITELLNAFIALLATVVTTFVIPWIKRKVGSEKMTEFLRWVDIGVMAAEQLYQSFECEEKKNYVVELLKKKGFKFTDAEVSAAIEGAVKRVHTELYGVGVGENG